ncbi:hypothetical protein Hs30E_03050 [Lactococcus hodotermopsidis]|uniref:Uncharacterized protein n=1 Tax=Pseudolactococcus hodotermopsidis TaxID=2709157 RepID=A0A6A0BBJ1_9LACT|nr:hypothetical protein Hs30E_03050 [Lactococcus hodotermopsidis]
MVLNNVQLSTFDGRFNVSHVCSPYFKIDIAINTIPNKYNMKINKMQTLFCGIIGIDNLF